MDRVAPLHVTRLTTAAQHLAARDVLVDAFASYPVMPFLLDADRRGYRDRLALLFEFFLAARAHRGEWVLGAAESAGGPLLGVALVSEPQRATPPDAAAAIAVVREATWRRLGAAAHARYQQYGAAAGAVVPDVPRLMLNLLGVRGEAQGRGVGGALLAAVHALATERPELDGVSLTTESPENVAWYAHHGYVATGEAEIAPGLRTWGMFRRR